MIGPPSFDSWYKFYQQFVLIFNLLVTVTLLPFGWLYLKIDTGQLQPYFSDTITQWVGSILLLSAISYFVWKTYQRSRLLMAEIPKELKVRDKLAAYYVIQIRKFVQYEIGASFLILGMLAFQPVLFAIAYLFILFIFSMDWPKYDKVVNHLDLNEQEQRQLESDQPLP